MNPVGRVSGEGRAEFSRTWRPKFGQKGTRAGGRGGGHGWGSSIFPRKLKILQGDKSDGFQTNTPVYHGGPGGGMSGAVLPI